MKATFKVKVELVLVTHFDDEMDEPIEETEVFDVGEKVEFDIVDEDKLWNVQFGDGSMCFGFDPKWVEIELS